MPAKKVDKRPYASAHFALELDGRQDIGLFRSIEGGGVRADVMQYQYGHAYERWRSLGKPKFEDLKVQVGMAMSKPFYDWIEKFFDGDATLKNGAIVAADFHYLERARREFTNAMIKELTFPQLSAKDSQPIYMSVGISVEGMAFVPGRGVKINPGPGAQRQKEWSPNKFRISLDGYEAACRNASKIDSFTIKQNVIEHHVGGFRAPMKCASQIDFPNIAFYVPESDAQPFLNQFTQRAIFGEQRTHSPNKTGYIQTYDNEGGPLFTLEFFEADIANVTFDKHDFGNEDIKQVKIELFTERMKFTYPRYEVV
ncbi:MAG TPA: phage tail protein [Kofleriaceae bacterium]